LNVVLNAILIPRLGMDGAAISSAITMVLYCALAVVRAKQLTGITATIFSLRWNRGKKNGVLQTK
jgi:O-antigen/teichoic acid export membrane protein